MTGKCPNGCEEKWFGTACDNARFSEKYIGCFRDHADRAISPEHNYSAQMTVESCTESCILRNNSIAGLQARGHCFCGESYAKYGPRKESDCSDPCTGNRYQKCGGAWANSVYFVCPIGFYGRNCVNRCHCSDGGPCRFNGSCLNSTLGLCKPGWTGSACHTRDCGINNGDCESDEKCETVDLGFENLLACRCKEGSYRDDNTCRPSYLHYVGCYKGSTDELPTSEASTIELCILKCKQLNKKYSLIRGGIACLCGDDYGQSIPDAECQVPCTGNKQQNCVGKNTVNGTRIYAAYAAKLFLRKYIGCYKDDKSGAMEKKFSWRGAGNNTIESCIRHCAFLNYTYAGLQYGYDCFCGNSFDKYGPLTESSCNMSCSGNSSQICGGIWANNVYAVNDIGLLWCTRDTNCEQNEVCNIIDLKNGNVSRCRCLQGFHRMNKWDLCTDVDECKSGASMCNPTSEECVNTIGSYRCECKVGFVNISGQCEDIDECQLGASTCNVRTEICLNNIGSYRCKCKNGYKNKSGHCEDVDECKSGESKCNPTSENCVNTIGSYRCECKVGFLDISGQCEDMDECGNNSIACDLKTELCQNTIGSYLCHCKSGYENKTFGNCTDIDECHLDKTSALCNAFSDCVNSIGSYTCRCKENFVCGKVEAECSSSLTVGIVVGTVLGISLLINAFFVASRIIQVKSRKSESGEGKAQSDLRCSSKLVSDQNENDYDDSPELIEDDNVYEQIALGECADVLNKGHEYAGIKQDD